MQNSSPPRGNLPTRTFATPKLLPRHTNQQSCSIICPGLVLLRQTQIILTSTSGPHPRRLMSRNSIMEALDTHTQPEPQRSHNPQYSIRSMDPLIIQVDTSILTNPQNSQRRMLTKQRMRFIELLRSIQCPEFNWSSTADSRCQRIQ